ncbi:MAG: ATP-binding cassette domain-containing protein [Clostridiales bacterium]|nr:ATP-binding cassette domain-containing protein [Clostridiales bacterium]
MKNVIELQGLTKDYGDGRGIFDLNMTIGEGEMMGYVGTNGSGKTTTIRNIMGFLKPTSGCAKVNGLTAWEHSSEYIKNIGYVAGEIAFPDLKTGTEFLKSQAAFLGLKDMSYADELVQRLQLDPSASLKRMSKGMKQKTALVAALMADPAIIILDEPTTGLDPLMRDSFLEIIKEEHQKGKTIFMSSHMFNELETTCDKVAMISNGHIIDIADIEQIRKRPVKEFKIEFMTEADYKRFKNGRYNITRDQAQYNQLTVGVTREELPQMLKDLTGFEIKFISEVVYDLERHFNEIIAQQKESKENVQ